jgi:3-isopropylmalate/(R)-2-methylmalate dehydratase large subunit
MSTPVSDASAIPDQPSTLAQSQPRTLAEKVWDDHLVVKGEDGQPDLI